MKPIIRLAAAFMLCVLMQAHPLKAQSKLAGETLRITRTTASIKIDGNLSDEGWQRVKPISFSGFRRRIEPDMIGVTR